MTTKSNAKKIDRPDGIPKQPKTKSFDGGNIVVFDPHCKCSAAAIAEIKGDGTNAR